MIDYKRVLICLARGSLRRRAVNDEAEIVGWATNESGEHYPIHAAQGGGSSSAGGGKSSSEKKIYDPKTKQYSPAPKGENIINHNGKSYKINFVHKMIEGGHIASADFYYNGGWHEVKSYNILRELGELAK